MATITGNTLVGVYPKALVDARYEQTDTPASSTILTGLQARPGDVSLDNMGGEWLYAKATTACAQYALCTISGAAVPLAAEATTTTIANGPVKLGIPQVAVAAGDFGWFWRGPGGAVGSGIKVLAANAALDVTLYTTGTPGVVDDANVDESVVSGLKLTATVTTQAGVECLASTLLTCNLGEPD